VLAVNSESVEDSLQSPRREFIKGVSGGMIVGFGIGLLVSVITLAGFGNNNSIPVGFWPLIIFVLIVGLAWIVHDARKAFSK